MNKYLNEIIDFLNNLKNENDNFFWYNFYKYKETY